MELLTCSCGGIILHHGGLTGQLYWLNSQYSSLQYIITCSYLHLQTVILAGGKLFWPERNVRQEILFL